MKEFIQNLKLIFEKKNKKFKLINEMFNFNFRINFKNKNKTFDEFFIRFNNLTIFLKLLTIIKIKYFKNKIIEKMRFKIFYFKICKN